MPKRASPLPQRRGSSCRRRRSEHRSHAACSKDAVNASFTGHRLFPIRPSSRNVRAVRDGAMSLYITQGSLGPVSPVLGAAALVLFSTSPVVLRSTSSRPAPRKGAASNCQLNGRCALVPTKLWRDEAGHHGTSPDGSSAAGCRSGRQLMPVAIEVPSRLTRIEHQAEGFRTSARRPRTIDPSAGSA